MRLQYLTTEITFPKRKMEPSIYERFFYGNTDLHYAAINGKTELAKTLLELKWLKNDRGYTALHYALLYGNPEITKLLLSTKLSSEVFRFKYPRPKYLVDTHTDKEMVVQSILPLSLLSI